MLILGLSVVTLPPVSLCLLQSGVGINHIVKGSAVRWDLCRFSGVCAESPIAKMRTSDTRWHCGKCASFNADNCQRPAVCLGMLASASDVVTRGALQARRMMFRHAMGVREGVLRGG